MNIIIGNYSDGRASGATSGPRQRGMLSFPLKRRPGRLRSNFVSEELLPKPRPKPVVVLPEDPPRSNPGLSTCSLAAVGGRSRQTVGGVIGK
jgi:hypothetical protein